jgi:hypothetical protein
LRTAVVALHNVVLPRSRCSLSPAATKRWPASPDVGPVLLHPRLLAGVVFFLSLSLLLDNAHGRETAREHTL